MNFEFWEHSILCMDYRHVKSNLLLQFDWVFTADKLEGSGH